MFIGIFLRVLRPALTVLCPARIEKKLIDFCLFFQTADELTVQCLQNAFVPMFSSIVHKIVPRSCFVRVLDCARILGVRKKSVPDLVVHALNCARFFALCPNFGRSRARLCSIYFAPRPFLNLAGTARSTSIATCERSSLMDGIRTSVLVYSNSLPCSLSNPPTAYSVLTRCLSNSKILI